MDKIERMFDKMIDYALERPEDSPSRVLIVNFSKAGIEKILTPARMELLRVVMQEKPKTVGELVAKLKRPKEAVSRDMRILENYGLLSFEVSGREKMPKVEKDLIAMPLSV
jgi:predicted transcriptional regulator